MRRSAPSPAVEFATAALAALALTWVAFAPALDARFVSDDVNAIVENEWVAGPFDPAGIVGSFSWWGGGRSDSPGYRPGATLSFAANRLLLGSEPRDFRVVNFALHALCTALLFALARRLGLQRGAAGAAAALFAVLPIHSEAVLWIVGRAELGAAAGFLGACLACLAHLRSGSPAALVVAGLALLVGTTFKENAVTVLAMPLVFFIASRAAGSTAGSTGGTGGAASAKRPAAGLPRRPAAGSAKPPASVARAATAFAALVAGALLYAALRGAAGGPPIAQEPGSLLDNPLSVVDPATRLLGAVAVLGRYLRLTLWPSPLSIDYSWDALGIGPGFVASADSAVAVVVLAALGWLAWRGPGRRDVVTIGLLMAAVSYSIVSNTVFVMGTILGERLFYLPSAGLCLAAGAAADTLVQQHRRDGAAVALAALVLAAVGVDRARAADWRTPVTLFESAARAVPRSARAHMELASAYGAAGRIADAERHFAQALAIKPDYTAAAYNRGNVLARAGRHDAAVEAYELALRLDPRFTRAWRNLALTHRLRGRSDESLRAMRRAVQASPGSSALRMELGEALLLAGRHREAETVYRELLVDYADVAVLHYNLGIAHHRLSGCAAAVDDYRRAAAAPDAPPQAAAAAAACLRQLGRDDEARALGPAAKVENRGKRR